MTATKRVSFCPSLPSPPPPPPHYGCNGNIFIKIFLKRKFFLSQSAFFLPLNLASPLFPPPHPTPQSPRLSGSLIRGNRRTERLAAMFKRTLLNCFRWDRSEIMQAGSVLDRHVNGEEKCPQATFTLKSYLYTKLQTCSVPTPRF